MAQSYSERHPVAEILNSLAVDLDPGAQGLIADKLFANPVNMEPFGRTATLLVDEMISYMGDADLDARRARGAKAQTIRGGTTDTVSISILDYALSHFTPFLDIIDDQLPGSTEERANRRLRRTLDILREQRAAALMFQAATGWTNSAVTAITGGGGAKWNTPTGTPLTDLSVMMDLQYDASNGFMPDTLILPWHIVRAIGRGNEIREVLIGSGSATSVTRGVPIPDDAVLTTISGVIGLPTESIFVPRMKRNTANPGAAAVLAEIWTDNVWLGTLRGLDYAQTKSGVTMAPIAAADFRYSGVSADAEDLKDPRGRKVIINEIHDYLAVKTSLGYLATDAL